ncbi:MAG TPA: hypothetical protein VFN40_07580 [Gemmatimonadales bacterium]|jgi:hypothetical protein|nr:hypothetical protein [Gemmatimonadales bacterium]
MRARSPLLLATLALATLPFTPARALQASAQDTEPERTSIGGYGEVHYTNATGANTPGEVNVSRFVVYLAHTFSERIAFRSELEVEDAKVEGGESGGEVALEQLYLDYTLSPAATIRAGLVLPPIGILNETHEPPTFNGVERPAFDHDVIPATWRDIGVGVVGSIPGSAGLNYRVFLLNGLVANGFSAEEGIRGGRQEGKEASFANPSLTGRLEWARPGLRIGGSFWYGGSAAQDPALGTGTFDNAVALVSADARYDVGPFMFRGVVANVSIADAEEINSAFGGQVGSRIAGGYVEGAYNLLSAVSPASTQRLDAFIRHERYNTQAGVPAGVTRDDALARRITTFGLSYKPVYNVVFKGDYQLRRNRAGVGEDEQLALGVGYQF